MVIPKQRKFVTVFSMISVTMAAIFGHPAFLRLGNSLEECARKYKGFCQKYKPKRKNPSKCHWGSRLLAGFISQTMVQPPTPKSRSPILPQASAR